MKKIIALAAGLIMSAGIASAASIQNGSFEGSGTIGNWTTLGTGSTSIAGWTVGSGSVDWIESYWQHADGNRSLDMTGSSAGSVWQDIAGLVVGATYEISFAMASNSAGGSVLKLMNVAVGNENSDYQFDRTGKSAQNMGWVYETFQFKADAATERLTFTSLEPGFYGPALDDVSIKGITAPVPLPASVLLLGGALAGMAGLRRRG